MTKLDTNSIFSSMPASQVSLTPSSTLRAETQRVHTPLLQGQGSQRARAASSHKIAPPLSAAREPVANGEPRDKKQRSDGGRGGQLEPGVAEPEVAPQLAALAVEVVRLEA